MILITFFFLCSICVVYLCVQEQYVFVYDSLLEALICGDTTMSSHAFPEVYNDLCLFDSDIGKTKLEEQFEVIMKKIRNVKTILSLSIFFFFIKMCKYLFLMYPCFLESFLKKYTWNFKMTESVIISYQRSMKYISF